MLQRIELHARAKEEGSRTLRRKSTGDDENHRHLFHQHRCCRDASHALTGTASLTTTRLRAQLRRLSLLFIFILLGSILFIINFNWAEVNTAPFTARETRTQEISLLTTVSRRYNPSHTSFRADGFAFIFPRLFVAGEQQYQNDTNITSSTTIATETEVIIPTYAAPKPYTFRTPFVLPNTRTVTAGTNYTNPARINVRDFTRKFFAALQNESMVRSNGTRTLPYLTDAAAIAAQLLPVTSCLVRQSLLGIAITNRVCVDESKLLGIVSSTTTAPAQTSVGPTEPPLVYPFHNTHVCNAVNAIVNGKTCTVNPLVVYCNCPVSELHRQAFDFVTDQPVDVTYREDVVRTDRNMLPWAYNLEKNYGPATHPPPPSMVGGGTVESNDTSSSSGGDGGNTTFSTAQVTSPLPPPATHNAKNCVGCDFYYRTHSATQTRTVTATTSKVENVTASFGGSSSSPSASRSLSSLTKTASRERTPSSSLAAVGKEEDNLEEEDSSSNAVAQENTSTTATTLVAMTTAQENDTVVVETTAINTSTSDGGSDETTVTVAAAEDDDTTPIVPTSDGIVEETAVVETTMASGEEGGDEPTTPTPTDDAVVEIAGAGRGGRKDNNNNNRRKRSEEGYHSRRAFMQPAAVDLTGFAQLQFQFQLEHADPQLLGLQTVEGINEELAYLNTLTEFLFTKTDFASSQFAVRPDKFRMVNAFTSLPPQPIAPTRAPTTTAKPTTPMPTTTAAEAEHTNATTTIATTTEVVVPTEVIVTTTEVTTAPTSSPEPTTTTAEADTTSFSADTSFLTTEHSTTAIHVTETTHHPNHTATTTPKPHHTRSVVRPLLYCLILLIIPAIIIPILCYKSWRKGKWEAYKLRNFKLADDAAEIANTTEGNAAAAAEIEMAEGGGGGRGGDGVILVPMADVNRDGSKGVRYGGDADLAAMRVGMGLGRWAARSPSLANNDKQGDHNRGFSMDFFNLAGNNNSANTLNGNNAVANNNNSNSAHLYGGLVSSEFDPVRDHDAKMKAEARRAAKRLANQEAIRKAVAEENSQLHRGDDDEDNDEDGDNHNADDHNNDDEDKTLNGSMRRIKRNKRNNGSSGGVDLYSDPSGVEEDNGDTADADLTLALAARKRKRNKNAGGNGNDDDSSSASSNGDEDDDDLNKSSVDLNRSRNGNKKGGDAAGGSSSMRTLDAEEIIQQRRRTAAKVLQFVTADIGESAADGGGPSSAAQKKDGTNSAGKQAELKPLKPTHSSSNLLDRSKNIARPTISKTSIAPPMEFAALRKSAVGGGNDDDDEGDEDGDEEEDEEEDEQDVGGNAKNKIGANPRPPTAFSPKEGASDDDDEEEGEEEGEEEEEEEDHDMR